MPKVGEAPADIDIGTSFIVHKASPIISADRVVSHNLYITRELPEDRMPDGLYDIEAKAVVDALLALPQATLLRVTAILLQRAAGVFRGQ